MAQKSSILSALYTVFLSTVNTNSFTYALPEVEIITVFDLLCQVIPQGSDGFFHTLFWLRRQHLLNVDHRLLWVGGQHVKGDTSFDVVCIPLCEKVKIANEFKSNTGE